METKINYYIMEDGKWVNFRSETYNTIERVPKIKEKIELGQVSYEVQDVHFNQVDVSSEVRVKQVD